MQPNFGWPSWPLFTNQSACDIEIEKIKALPIALPVKHKFN